MDDSTSDGYCPGCLLREGLEGEDGGQAEQGRQRLGPYELIEKIGQGGMGVVYRARQVNLNRVVAVKVLPFGSLVRADAVARFKAEAGAAAGLQHPNIVAIHDVGEEAGQPYFSMDYIEGRTLAETVRENPLPARHAATWLRTIAGAVHHAHRQGVLHRDLKPSNILIDGSDQPRITDFGLAKRLSGEGEITLKGQVLGSPNFMAPEQAEGRSQEVGPPADIYGLGALLYHMLTRQPPFQAETLTTLLKQVIEAEPLAPRLLNPSIPRDLETICLKCLEKEPARRYATAADLAAELGRFLEDQPIRARPLSAPERAWRWCRRQPVRASLIAGLIVAIGLGSGGVAWQWRAAQRNAKAESEQRGIAQRAAYAANIRLIQGQIDDSQFAAAHTMLLDLPEAFRGWEWGWLQRACNEDVMTLNATNGLIFADFSPDGREVVSGGSSPKIYRWDLASGRELEPWTGHANRVAYCGFSPDGRKFVSAGWHDRTARIRDTRTGQISATLTNPLPIFLAAFSPDSRQVVTAGWNGKVQVWDAETGAFTGLEATYGDQVFAAAFSPDGRRIAFGGGNYFWADSLDTSVRVWDLSAGTVQILGRHSELAGCVCWSPDGSVVASCSWSGEIKLWDPVSGGELPPLPQAKTRTMVLRIAWSPDGRFLAAAGGGFPNVTAKVDLYDVSERRWIRQYSGHSKALCDVRFSADSRRMVTASLDATVKIWPVEPFPPFQTLEGHDQAVWAVDYSTDGTRIATGSFDNTARIWDARTGRNLHTFAVGCPVLSLALSPDGRHLATPGPGADAVVWDLESGRTSRRLTGHEKRIEALAWSPDGRWIATASRDGTVRIWDPATGRCASSLSGHVGWVRAARFSPGSDFLATGGDDRTVRVWETAEWRCRCVYTNHVGGVLALAFNPRHRTQIASGSTDRTVRLWNVVTGADLGAPLRGFFHPLTSLAFNPDGRRLATVSNSTELWNNLDRDYRVLLWDITTGQPVLRLFAHDNAVYCVAFSPDGLALASGSADNTVRIRGAFPWRANEYPGDAQTSLAARIEMFKRDLRRQEATVSDGRLAFPGRRVVGHVLGELHLPLAGSKTRPLLPVPERSADAGPDQLDLSNVYNVALAEAWQPIQFMTEADLSLARLGAGIQTLAGVRFDVRGLIQLRRAAADCELFPDRVAIPVGRRFQRVHVLHGARWPALHNQPVGALVLHYADGSEDEWPILYGEHVRQEDDTYESRYECQQAQTAWKVPVELHEGARNCRLFMASFASPRPGLEVERIDYVSKLTRCAPFLVALTVE